ncbi:hypothetical protein BH11MYX1_BH11MYX1_07330 [soil metagenome]
MRTTCPNCGAPIEFRYDDSFVRVCGNCNFAVQRTDRGVESLGKVADLTPIESPLRLFAEGHYGTTSFLLVGMAQIKHEAGGIWQEWYAKLDGGQWGWLAEAQGRYYLTFEVPWLAAPSAVSVGEKLEVPLPAGRKIMTVGETTEATYASAKGELPFRLVPNETFHYADLSDGEGAFATLDFGDDGPPRLYVGSQVELADLRLSGGEVGPSSSDSEIRSKALACPVCSAPIELHVPGETQRVVCSHCNTLLDTSSNALAILGQLASRATPTIPLGAKGTFSEGELVVIGYVQRSALVDGDWWPFEEYLLYRAGLGYRWLVRSDGHWNYVQPIATGAVETTVKGARYDGVEFLRFQSADLRVDEVLGEFYWKVQQGEQVSSEDCIAPPAMVSRESSATEENWSLSTFMTSSEVIRAFAPTDLPIGDGDGIAPNQPDAWKHASAVMSIAFFVLIVLGMVFAMAAKDETVLATTVSLGGGPGGGAPLTTPPGLASNLLTQPAEVPICVEYKAVFTATIQCEKITQTERDSYAALFDATYIPTDRSLLELGCGTSLDSLRQGLSATCKLPTHEAYLATAVAPPVAAAGSGSDIPANEVSTAPADSIWFSEPLQIAGGRNIELSLSANSLSNDWVFVSADLVESSTGGVVSSEAAIEHYAGYEDGESWSEGTFTSSTVFGPQPAGTYILRLEAQHGSAGLLPINVTLHQGVFRGKWLAWAMVILGIPLLVVGLTSYFHEKKRWENSTAGKAPFTPVAMLVVAVVGVFIGLGALLKAVSSSSRSDD